jgi:hypothetical protein
MTKRAGAVDVERMRHRVVRVHLVDEAQLDLVADAELPVDLRVLGSGVLVDRASSGSSRAWSSG